MTTLQGVAPESLVVVTGDNQERPYRFADCAAYATRVRAQLLEFLQAVDDQAVQTRPEPVHHCGQCRWQPRCSAQWRREDDLSLVAFMRRDHARAFASPASRRCANSPRVLRRSCRPRSATRRVSG